MSFYLAKTPNIIQRIFKNYIWSFSFSKDVEKTIYLTFDDGPTPEITEWTLDELKKFKAKATFFCIGKNIENHPEIYKRVIKEGHSIGNHTHNHLNGWKSSNATYLKNILKCEKSIQSKMKNNSNSKLKTHNSELLFRPPYGKIKSSQARKLREEGYKIILWDVLSADFDQKISKEKCLQNVIDNCENGSIVVFHDSLKAEGNLRYVLPKILEYLSNKGYDFKRIAQQD
jgi:peptidoglycan/xylan/chitin deacetylase (PgdA/CDA1 family)